MKAEEQYLGIGRELKAEESQMFGKPCFKVNGKAFIAFFQDCMIFKLDGDAHKEARELSHAVLFDPSGKKRPMKEWIQVPFAHSKFWPTLAKEALTYVKSKK